MSALLLIAVASVAVVTASALTPITAAQFRETLQDEINAAVRDAVQAHDRCDFQRADAGSSGGLDGVDWDRPIMFTNAGIQNPILVAELSPEALRAAPAGLTVLMGPIESTGTTLNETAKRVPVAEYVAAMFDVARGIRDQPLCERVFGPELLNQIVAGLPGSFAGAAAALAVGAGIGPVGALAGVLSPGGKLGDRVRGNTTKTVLSLGHGSMVGYHQHGKAFSTLLWGRKRWKLLPPDAGPPEGGMTEVPSCTHDSEDAQAEPAVLMVCTQRPDETFYIPESWWHATKSLEPSAALSSTAQVEPGGLAWRFEEGERLVRQDKFEQSIEMFLQVLERWPLHFPSWSNLGVGLLFTGLESNDDRPDTLSQQAAIASFRKAIGINPKCRSCWLGLGRTLLLDSEVPAKKREGIAALQKALELAHGLPIITSFIEQALKHHKVEQVSERHGAAAGAGSSDEDIASAGDDRSGK